MANGPIGRVAATQAQQGGTYSDAINQQVDLIQKQRALNLQNRLAQEKENRKFRDQQRQNIYDFDVTGLAPEYAEQIKKAQDQMSEWLQPGSEVRYENQEQLTKDIANLNNMYLWGKRFSTTARAAEAQFEDTLVNGSSIPGTKAVEGEDALMNRRDAFNTGGFKSMEVTGGPGGISIIGIPIQESPEGGGAFMFDEESDKVDILSQEADGSFVFRTPLVKDLYNVDQKYVDATSAEMAGNLADSDWDSNPRSVQLEYREKLADSDPSFAQKDDQGNFKISDEKLKEMHRKEAQDGWNTFHEQQVPFSMVSNTPMISDRGATLYKLKDDKGKDTTIGLFTGGERREVTHLGTTGSGENTMIVYEYTDPDDSNRVIEASVPFNTAEGYALMEDAGYVGTIAKLVADNPDLSIEDLKKQFGTTGESAGDETTTTDGTGEGVEGAKAEEQQATTAPDTIGEFRASLKQAADRYEIRASRDKKLAREIINEPPSVQIRRINEEIAAIEKELEETPRFKRGVGSRFRSDKAALERLKELRDKQPTLNEETKNRRIDELDKQIADIKEQQLELQDRFEKEGGTNRNLVQRESLNNQLLNLEEQRSALDLFGRGAEIREQFGAPDVNTAQQIEAEAPEAAAAIENSNVEAPNPNTGEPVTVDASAPEKQQAALAAFGGIIPLEAQEDEIQEYIQELFVNVAPSDSTWLWTGAQEDFESGKNSDPVPPWCAAWVADMILRANPDFDFSAVESPSYGQTEKQAGETNRVRAQHYQKIGEAVSKTGDQYDAQVGDVVIKKVGTQFHVGFFAGYDEDGNVLILGGNQADSLNVTAYPADQIVSVRRIDVAAIDKEDVEKISATINDGKVT